MSKANTVSEQDLREIVGLKATSLFRSMLDELDQRDQAGDLDKAGSVRSAGAPSLDRPAVPALVSRTLPPLADPLPVDDEPASAPGEDAGDPDPGTLQDDEEQGTRFLNDSLLAIHELEQLFFSPPPAPSRQPSWPLSHAAC